MNERLKELAEQAGLEVDESVLIGNIFDIYFPEGYHTERIERFAELVRADEREACAKFLDDFAKTQMVPVKDTWRMGVVAAANAVRDKK
jgi:hypothetical protein